MIKFFITAVLSSAALFAPAQPSVPPNFTPQLILSGIDPVSMAADPEGRIFLTEKDGNLLLVKPDVPGSTLVAKLQVDQAGERGLLGVAVHPEFEYNHYIYLYYSVLNGNHNRLSRFVVHEEHIHLEEEEILLDFEPLNGFYHNGGDLKFGPDGMLYVSTGDGFNSTMAQSHTSLLGKVLRLRDNGTIPTDNPFYFTNSGIYKAIYALGFRNPFTFSFNNMAKLFVNDVGNTKWEEINNVLPGKNYGWPYIEGRAADNPDAIVPADYLDPFYVYDHDVGCAVTGAAFYDGDVQSFPSEYYGKYFFGDYCNGTIRAIDPISGEKLDFLTNSERAVYITFIRGDLYYMSFPGGKQGKLWRIYYSTDDKPQIVIQPTSQLATHDETVQFSVEAAGEGPFQYQWYRDGSALQGQVNKLLILENVQLSDNGSSFVCIVSNQNGFVESAPATLSVTDRERPTLTLETPWADYVAGEQITVSGSAFDAVDGALDRSKLTWRVDFQHDFHSHPLVTNLSNSNEVSFTVPKVGETSSNTWVRIYLVAENSIGLTAERFIEIYPKKSTFTVDASHNDNLLVSLDGKAYQVPFNIEAVVGTTRSLFGALEQYKGQNLYLFQDWNRQIYSTALTFDVAESDTTFTINYEKIFLGKGTGLTGFYYNGYKKFSGNPQLVRIDSMINFNWYAGSPDPDINVDN
ncbi:MAG TPA: PQQ-dependent sugar dehydrogenase, partial [Chryseosolibacter sp.]|nr:PQQ-dependent sugar dehydrogenase [Chryseosolibacter sp.]